MNVFVLMLENRSFDHMLGFSGITGVDAANGQATSIRGLTGAEANGFRGTSYTVTAGAAEAMPLDPGHEFADVLEQLAGSGATYVSGRYPPLDNSGFVSDYVDSPTSGQGGAACCVPATGESGRADSGCRATMPGRAASS